MPYPYRIIHANLTQIRKQISNALNELALLIGGSISDDVYGAGWDGSTDVAPSQNAVYDKIETLSSGVSPTLFDANTILKADTDDTPVALTVAEQRLVGRITAGVITALTAAETRTLLNVVERRGYIPGLMYYDAANPGYYSKDAVTVASNNQVTAVGYFRTNGTGYTTNQRIITVSDSSIRLAVTILENDHATAPNKLQMVVQNSGGTPVAVITSANDVVSSYCCFFVDYDGDAGTASMIINGVDEKDATSPLHVLTTGTLETGTMSVRVGATTVPDQYFFGVLSHLGYHDTSGLNWADFMSAIGDPIGVSEDWADDWGSQPVLWSPHGQLENNRGTAGALFKNGGMYISNENIGITFPLDAPIFGTFTPVIWDNSLSSSEGQTYTAQSGRYMKFGNAVWYWIEIIINSLGSLTTSDPARIGGFPFESSGSLIYPSNVGLAGSLALPSVVGLSGYLTSGGSATRMVITKFDATTGTGNLTVGELSTGGRIIVSGNYLI